MSQAQALTKQDATLPEKKLNFGVVNTLMPKNTKEAWDLAVMLAQSNVIPPAFQKQPANCFIAIGMGMAVGLDPFQALQNIYIVNNKPAMYGDALPALVLSSPKCEKFHEYFDEKTNTAYCVVRRKGDTEDTVRSFSHEDAKRAGYIGKQGPWSTNEKRMKQMRARGFALRDKFADVLKGIRILEEVQDYEVIDAPPPMPMPKRITPSAQEAQIVDVRTENENQAAAESQPPDEALKVLADAELEAEQGDAQEPVDEQPATKPAPKKEEEKISIDERKELMHLLKVNNKTGADLQKYLVSEHHITSTSEIGISQLEGVKKWIQGKLL